MDIPPLRGIHHVKLAVSDLSRALTFYESALGAQRIPEADHKRESDGTLYAYILNVPGLSSKMELRLNAEQAKKHAHFDSFTIAVDDRKALETWDKILIDRGILHSPIIPAIQAWLIVLQDPDGNRLRLYTLEQHGPDLKPDEDNEWLQD